MSRKLTGMWTGGNRDATASINTHDSILSAEAGKSCLNRPRRSGKDVDNLCMTTRDGCTEILDNFRERECRPKLFQPMRIYTSLIKTLFRFVSA